MPKSSSASLLLDTHVWIWLMNGSSELSQESLELLNGAANQDGLQLAPISIWEIATLARKNRLTLKVPIRDWVETALAQPGIAVTEMSPTIAIDSAMLPGDFRGDPADRMIVATARSLRVPIVTRDKAIIKYGETNNVDVVPV